MANMLMHNDQYMIHVGDTCVRIKLHKVVNIVLKMLHTFAASLCEKNQKLLIMAPVSGTYCTSHFILT